MKFTHLHLHNEHSILDGVGTTTQFADIAKEYGQTHLAVTNHGNVDGAIAHQRQCLKKGLKPIIGCELYVVDDMSQKVKGETRNHAVVLVETEEGWNNLLKMLTIANLRGFYRRPRVDTRTLLKHLRGLILLTGCSLSILNMKEGKKFIRRAVKRIGKDKVHNVRSLHMEA